MRIDALSKVSQLYQNNSIKKLDKKSEISNLDQLEISQTGKEYHIAKHAVAKEPDVRMDKVNEFKQAMQSGNYNVSLEEVADRLVEHYFSETI